MVEYGFTSQIDKLINEKLNEEFERGYEQGKNDSEVRLLCKFCEDALNFHKMDSDLYADYDEMVRYTREVMRMEMDEEETR